MKPRLLYVELKTGYNSTGPAWIGLGHFSKTGRTIYFDGKAFEGGRIGSMHRELLTGDYYWISGVKKDMTDRHWIGSGKIGVDRTIHADYLDFVGLAELPKSQYYLVDLEQSVPKELVNRIKNQSLSDEPTDKNPTI
jgi:hypothetical protein